MNTYRITATHYITLDNEFDTGQEFTHTWQAKTPERAKQHEYAWRQRQGFARCVITRVEEVDHQGRLKGHCPRNTPGCVYADCSPAPGHACYGPAAPRHVDMGR